MDITGAQRQSGMRLVAPVHQHIGHGPISLQRVKQKGQPRRMTAHHGLQHGQRDHGDGKIHCPTSRVRQPVSGINTALAAETA